MIISRAASSVQALYMDVTEDGELVCSTRNNTIARVQVNSGKVAFDKSDRDLELLGLNQVLNSVLNPQVSEVWKKHCTDHNMFNSA
ncbi:hypothetical protein PoB_003373100 [Plakobranchus ocellatus]|uniref:MHC class II antigen n=1 Tax=Plakobranchus ocellatus TaxID=259542 RepID=A0AAV4A7N5_9GAST|nr:hypothetical protein PoB_003373100 [Plakobranchus ocellatus]